MSKAQAGEYTVVTFNHCDQQMTVGDTGMREDHSNWSHECTQGAASAEGSLYGGRQWSLRPMN